MARPGCDDGEEQSGDDDGGGAGIAYNHVADFPCCVLSYFSLVFVMEQLTNPSYKSQLSRAINYKCTQDTDKFCAFCLLEKFHPRKIRAVLC